MVSEIQDGYINVFSKHRNMRFHVSLETSEVNENAVHDCKVKTPDLCHDYKDVDILNTD